MATNIYKLVVTPEVDFKKKQMNSNVFEVAVSKLEEDDVVFRCCRRYRPGVYSLVEHPVCTQ